jgi:peroxiredoxin
VIGCAKSKFITSFRKETRFPHDLFCDPERKIYSNLGLIHKHSTAGSSDHVHSGVLMG